MDDTTVDLGTSSRLRRTGLRETAVERPVFTMNCR
jgi:hypothetical protein